MIGHQAIRANLHLRRTGGIGKQIEIEFVIAML
jgi:hypothetical protein